MALITADIEKLEIVPDASHLFEEFGALDRVAYLANDWFTKYLSIRPWPAPSDPEFSPTCQNGGASESAIS